jgi:imidazolonepropionase-like amidohydrolase
MSTVENVRFKDVRVIDCDRDEAFVADVLVREGEIVAVEESGLPDSDDRVVEGRGRTMMSGLCDAHVHLSWNNGDLDGIALMEVEDNMMVCAESARVLLDSGYTMAVGAASAKMRLDVATRDAINAGMIPGPRYLAAVREICSPAGMLVPGISTQVSGVEEMRRAVRDAVRIGADTIKLIQSGESITQRAWAKDDYFTDDEVAVAVEEAHHLGRRVSTHARSAESCLKAARNGVDILYHMSYADEACLDILEERKDEVFVAPGLHWLYASLYEAGEFGFSQEAAEAVGYKLELDAGIEGLKEMHRRGIRVLPGGDYGFNWTPHGTNARDLSHFVELLGMSPMEAIRAATVLGGEMMLDPTLGKVERGFKADLLLVDGDPLADVSVLQDHTKLVGIMKGGAFHKDPDVTDFRANGYSG